MQFLRGNQAPSRCSFVVRSVKRACSFRNFGELFEAAALPSGRVPRRRHPAPRGGPVRPGREGRRRDPRVAGGRRRRRRADARGRAIHDHGFVPPAERYSRSSRCALFFKRMEPLPRPEDASRRRREAPRGSSEDVSWSLPCPARGHHSNAPNVIDNGLPSLRARSTPQGDDVSVAAPPSRADRGAAVQRADRGPAAGCHAAIPRNGSSRTRYLEIYNEVLHDLLNPRKGDALKIREHPDLGIYVEPLCELSVTAPDDIFRRRPGRKPVGLFALHETRRQSSNAAKIIDGGLRRRSEGGPQVSWTRATKYAASRPRK